MIREPGEPKQENMVEIPNSLVNQDVHTLITHVAEKNAKEMAEAHDEENGIPKEITPEVLKDARKDFDTLSLWASLGRLSMENIDETKVSEKEKGALRLLCGLAEDKNRLEATEEVYSEVLKKNGLL